MRTQLIISILVITLMVSCQEKKDPQIAEAATIHNAMVEQAGALESTLDSLSKNLETLKTALKPADSLKIKEIEEVLTGFTSTDEAIEKWEEDLVEVPGNMHHHHEGGEHHHEHKPADDKLTPKQLLDIQQVKKEELDVIQKNVADALAKAEVLLK